MNEGIMQQVTLNAEKSRELYQKTPKHYGVRECYTNIFRAITDNISKAFAGDWKVAYGYYSIGEFPNLLARHCFILDEENHVIDPTIFAQEKIDLSHSYFVMYVFSSFNAYLDVLKEEGYRPGLVRYLQPYEQEAHTWAREHNYYLYG